MMNKYFKYYKCIFLSLSCNDDNFKQLTNTVCNTWAKDLIDGKYNDFTFFYYTSCDEQHPTPCIDEYVIYVDCPDDISHTYTKTKLAYQLLKYNGYITEYIFRTNTSTYVHVPNCIDKINTLKENDVIGNNPVGYYINDKYLFDIILGNAWIFPTSILDKIFITSIDESNFSLYINNFLNTKYPDCEPESDETLNLYVADDIIMTFILYYFNIYFNLKPLSFNPWKRYKCCLEEDYEEYRQQYINSGFEELSYNYYHLVLLLLLSVGCYLPLMHLLSFLNLLSCL